MQPALLTLSWLLAGRYFPIVKYTVTLLEKPERNRPQGGPRRGWEHNSKMDLKEVV
jgi:hypothetical protein